MKKKFDKKGPPRTRADAPRTGGARARPSPSFDRRGSAPAPFERRKPAGGGFEARTRSGTGDKRDKRDTRDTRDTRSARPPARRFPPRPPEAPSPSADVPEAEVQRDPYQRAQRPRPAGTFTVTLDPDVARVFRGDASVNKALRLVLQLMEVAAPRPRSFPPGERGAPRPAGGAYRGSAQARGFVRKPRFEDDNE